MNREGHRAVGVTAGAAFTVIKYMIQKKDDPNLAFPWGELLTSIGVGYSLASLPDMIEPATDPNHRKYFHSSAMTGLVGYGTFGKHMGNMDKNFKKAFQPIGVAYLPHLAADSFTPRSLPLIHPKIV